MHNKLYPNKTFAQFFLESRGLTQNQTPSNTFTLTSAPSNTSPNVVQPPQTTFTMETILEQGCFHPKALLETALEKLRTKKNLILQGPPGVGKTWLAKKLAYALMGVENDEHIQLIQFHPNLSYEDFVCGYRPTETGGLKIAEDSILKLAKTAKNNPSNKFVLIIEEINRSNPAQVFGEMLTLIENDKRSEDYAMPLTYHNDDKKPVHLPENLYIIGTMNLADRSLAVVDFAFRRRFTFIDLEPQFNDTWKEVLKKMNVSDDGVHTIFEKIQLLNDEIEKDTNLGRQCRIGHSYFTPNESIQDWKTWFNEVCEYEIKPLLEEYWYDKKDNFEKQNTQLIGGLR